jgi:hypothetical protein
MNARSLLKNTPNWVIAVCVTVFLLACVTAFTVLSITGSSADDFARFLNTGLNLLGLFVGGGAWITASSANEAAHRTNQRLDGKEGEVDGKD